MKEINSLFALKAVAAFLVVLCHIPMITKFVWEPIMTMAVPFFFIITGYFLYDIDESKSYAKAIKSIKRTIPIVVVVNLFYYLWIFSLHGNTIRSLGQLVEWIFYGNQVSGHLWYLTAMVEALVLLAIMLRFRLGKWIALLPLLTLANIFAGKYYFLTGGFFPKQNIYSVFYSALPFISTGYLIHKWEARLLSFKHWGIVLVSSLALSWVEYVNLNNILPTLPENLVKYGNTFWGTLPASVALMVIGLQYPNLMGGGKSAVFQPFVCVGKHYSGTIYYFHVAMGTLLLRVLVKVGMPDLYEILGTPLVFLLCILLGWVIQKAQNKMGIHILR